MRVIYAVVKDLLTFAWSTVFQIREKAVSPALPLAAETDVSLPPQREGVSSVPEETRIGSPNVAYISSSPTRVFLRPVWALDTVTAALPYGTAVSVVSFSGRFAYIEATAAHGWILKDEMVTDRSAVWPQFVSHAIYDATAKETRSLREIIADEFFTRELFLPLTTEEFVWYRLLESGRTIVWGSERPRLAGRWNTLLKGQRGVFMSVEPKTGSILEAYPDSTHPFLAYVTAVAPDNTIEIESVGQENEGEYRKESVPKAVWQLWRPIYIQLG